MREGILRIMFVGDVPKSCLKWKTGLESLIVKGVKRIEVLTATRTEEIHEGLFEMGIMPHLFIVEGRKNNGHFNVLGMLRDILPLAMLALVVDRNWDERLLVPYVVSSKQSKASQDVFVAEDADEEELVELLRLVVCLHAHQKKTLGPPLQRLMERRLE